ncbi:MAG: hypothetical protein AAF614_41545 [Chloroflexota bacterium]
MWQVSANKGWQRHDDATAPASQLRYTFTFARPDLARQFVPRLEKLGARKREAIHVNRRNETVIFTLRETAVGKPAISLLDLLTVAGRDLHGFNQQPAETQTTFFGVQHSESVGMTEPPSLTAAQWRTAVWQIATAEWKRHFRRVWQFGNVVISAFYIILVWLLAITLWEQQGMPLAQAAQFPLLFSSSLAVFLAAEAFVRWPRTAQAEVLFHGAEPPARGQPLSLSWLHEESLLRRPDIACGIGVGMALIWLSHMGLFLALWGLVQAGLPSIGWSVTALAVWLLLMVNSIGVGLLLSHVGKHWRWGIVTSWLSYLGIILSFALVVRDGWDSIAPLWLWPFIGWPTALVQWAEGGNGWLPFLLGVVGSGGIWGTAVYLYGRRTAVWQEKTTD